MGIEHGCGVEQAAEAPQDPDGVRTLAMWRRGHLDTMHTVHQPALLRQVKRQARWILSAD